jgi:hypothetical protein
MTIGTMFTLFIVPALYVLFARDHRKERERAAAEEEADGAINYEPSSSS